MKSIIYIVEKKEMKTHAYYLELVSTFTNIGQAIDAAIRESRLERKAIYMQMKINEGNWSRMESGKANFPAHRIDEFCAIVKNPILLYHINYQSGYEPRILPKNIDAKLKEKDIKIEKLEEKVAYLEGLVRQSVASSHDINPRFKKEAN